MYYKLLLLVIALCNFYANILCIFYTPKYFCVNITLLTFFKTSILSLLLEGVTLISSKLAQSVTIFFAIFMPKKL